MRGAVMTTPGIGPATVGLRGSELFSALHAPMTSDEATATTVAGNNTLRFIGTNPTLVYRRETIESGENDGRERWRLGPEAAWEAAQSLVESNMIRTCVYSANRLIKARGSSLNCFAAQEGQVLEL